MIQDHHLVKGCQKGERQYQKILYEKYSGQMMAVAMRYTKSIQIAEDVLQEAFIRVFDKIKTFNGDSLLVHWIKKIVINVALNSERGKLYAYPMKDVTEQTIASPKEDEVITSLAYEQLLELIMELPDRCRIIFSLVAIEGYKHQEVASKLKLNIGTSKSQYARAKKILAKRILEENKETVWNQENLKKG